MPKKNSMGYSKQQEKYTCQKAWEKKAWQRAWRKEKKKKERNKDSAYLQIKGIHPKKRDSWFKGVPKIF